MIVFGHTLPRERQSGSGTIIATEALRSEIESSGCRWVDLNALIDPGSIYEASTHLEQLTGLRFADGERIAASYTYEGYELWWLHLNSLFHYFCLPYTQYHRLLEHAREWRRVSVYRPPYRSLFIVYFHAHGVSATIVSESRSWRRSLLPFGVLVQILLTLVSLPVLALRTRRVMVYTGDKFEKGKDFDARMRFIYEELRKRRASFVEFIRGLESWRVVLLHAFIRRRPVVYSEAVVFTARLINVLTGGRRRMRRDITARLAGNDAQMRFWSEVAVQYLYDFDEDRWAIQIMRRILTLAGIRTAIVPVASERSFHAVLGCKLRGIPTVGILHGVSSRHYNVSDFMTGFDGVQRMSVDQYGLWSDWWKEYYVQNSRAYSPDQLFVSGPMRPWLREAASLKARSANEPISVLFVSEQLAPPEETLPYLQTLLDTNGINVYITFRPYRDGFEEWLKRNKIDILERIGEERVIRSGIHDAIERADVVVGAHSTGVLEALLQLKVPVYFRTQKWGDYYEFSIGGDSPFFAETPDELIRKIKKADTIPIEERRRLQERYFGDPRENGSAWVVERALRALQ